MGNAISIDIINGNNADIRVVPSNFVSYVSTNVFNAMKPKVNIATIFPKHLFWDMDYSKLIPSKDKDIIIPRAMLATTQASFEEDIEKLEHLYSKNDIIKYLKSTKERISNMVCRMVADRYNIEVFFRFKV